MNNDNDLIRPGDVAKRLKAAAETDDLSHGAVEWVLDEIAAIPAVTAPQGVDALLEALTPSGDTKAAYMGEFSFLQTMTDNDGDEVMVKTYVPWTTIKEIMAAIRERAALAPAQPAPTEWNATMRAVLSIHPLHTSLSDDDFIDLEDVRALLKPEGGA